MAPWLLLSLSLAQSPDPAAAADAQRTQEQALQRQGEAQSADGTLDGGSPTGAPDPSLTGTGGAGGVQPLPDSGAGDAGTSSGSTYTVPSPLPGTGGAGDAGTRFAPGTDGTAPGSTGTTPPSTGTQGTGGSTVPLDTRSPDSTRSAAAQPTQQDAAGAGQQPAEAQEADPAGTVSLEPQDIEGPPSAATPEEAATALRAQVQALQEREAQLTARQEELAAQTQELQERVVAAEQRAEVLEDARIQRLGALEEVSGLMVDMDTALAVGDTDVEAQLDRVMEALDQVATSADESGQGEAVLNADQAREELAYVADAIANRNYYEARLALQAAAEVVRGARRGSLDESNGPLLTPR